MFETLWQEPSELNKIHILVKHLIRSHINGHFEPVGKVKPGKG